MKPTTKPARTVPPSEAARLLGAHVTRSGPKVIAEQLGVSVTAVRLVAACQRRAGTDLQGKLASPPFGIPVEAWTAPPGQEAATSPPTAIPSLVASSGQDGEGPLGPTIVICEANVRRLEQQAEAAALDPLCSHRDRAGVGAALNHALRHLARLRGEDELSEGRILKSPAFGRIIAAIREAGAPFPDACRAIGAALTKIAGTP